MPVMLNGPMPAEEYTRYAAFWTEAIKACVLFLTVLALILLCWARIWIGRIVEAQDRTTQAIERQTALDHGGAVSQRASLPARP